MLAYQTRLHRKLMEESERGLFAAIGAGQNRWSRVAEEVAYDCQKFSAWESRHARALIPIAESQRQVHTVVSLRQFEVSLVHRRALVETLREHSMVGPARERLFAAFYGPRDYRNSVLSEHFQYQLAVASTLGAARLNDFCHDPAAGYLLEKYEVAYRRYFWAYCRWQLNEDPLLADILRLSMENAKANADRLKRCLLSTRDTPARDRDRPRLRA